MINDIFPLPVQPAVHTTADFVASTNLVAIPYATAGNWIDTQQTYGLVLNN